jgi:hypothetical protein
MAIFDTLSSWTHFNALQDPKILQQIALNWFQKWIDRLASKAIRAKDHGRTGCRKHQKHGKDAMKRYARMPYLQQHG